MRTRFAEYVRVSDWCWKWRLVINQEKTQIVHFRKQAVQRSSFVFNFGSTPLTYANEYKYLGLTLDEHLTFKPAIGILSDSAGRALGSVPSKVKNCRDLSFKSFTQLYKSCVCPVSDYAAGVWGFNEQTKSDTVQYRAIRSFLRVHKRTPNSCHVWRYGLGTIKC